MTIEEFSSELQNSLSPWAELQEVLGQLLPEDIDRLEKGDGPLVVWAGWAF